MEPLLLIPIILSFFITFLALPIWIKKVKNVGLTGRDVHKVDKRNISEAGGVVVIMGFIIGTLSYIAIKTFYLGTTDKLIEIFALISSVMIISFIGMIDDILGWKIGLGKRVRLFLCLMGAIPLVVINAGISRIGIPFIDGVSLGLLYPFVLIPLGVVGASTTFNFIAGYNGLETSQSIIIISALSIVAFFTGNSWLVVIGLVMVVSLIAFYIFNKFPAKVLPGDTLTYSVGALIAIFAILGNFERVAIFIFIPYIIEVFLKLRGKLKKESFAKLNSDGSLDAPENKVYGLEHVAINILKKIKKGKKVYEKDVVYAINVLQIFFVILGFIIFRQHIF